ncbi:MAG: carbon-nitrogen hydrolase family protein [Gemmatimonadota bacterium]
MDVERVRIALITEVFPDDPEGVRLRARLQAAREQGAALAVLPELPLNSWSPATRVPREEDAEEPGGRRQRLLARIASEVGVGVLGGAIVQEPGSGRRHNTALLYDATGRCLSRYRKVHLPEEEGYWETSHYEAGTAPPGVVRAFGLGMGIQVCSDVNRPTGFQLLAAAGADLVCAPRATPPETYHRWRLVLRANAVMACTFVLSANRPRPEAGASIGGPSLAVAPDGSVLAETPEPVSVVDLDEAMLRSCRAEYPGYLRRFPPLYAHGWKDVAGPGDTHP